MGINQLTSVSGSGSGSGSSWGSFGMADGENRLRSIVVRTRHEHTHTHTQTHTRTHRTKANILFGFANYSICIVFLMYFIIHSFRGAAPQQISKQTKPNKIKQNSKTVSKFTDSGEEWREKSQQKKKTTITTII